MLDVRCGADRSKAIELNSESIIDVAALEAFAAGEDCFVTKFYDQSGNANHLEQADPALQPQIVAAGQVTVDDSGRTALYFENDQLSGTGIEINNHSLTALYTQQSEYSKAYKYPIALGDVSYRYFNIRFRDSRAGGKFGDGSDGADFGDMAKTLQPAWPTIITFDSNSGAFRFFRNLSLVQTKEMTLGPASTGLLHVGSYSGYISEIALYPALSDTDREKLYQITNNFYQRGPSRTNKDTLLPQSWRYQVDLYDWLKARKTAEFVTTLGPLAWNGSYANLDKLANLWLAFHGGQVEFSQTSEHTDILRADPAWFVLNNGHGKGIEATGDVRMFRQGDGSAAALANFYYENGAIGFQNPYFRNKAVCMRILTTVAVDLMMTDQLQDDSPQYWSNADFAGGAMSGWLNGYASCRHLLDKKTLAAFHDGFEYMTWKILAWGAHDVNGNMDTKAVAAIAKFATLTDDPFAKAQCVRAVRKLLFGSETGTPATTDYVLGLYRRAGYIDEGDSPETTYNGVSLLNLLEAYHSTRGDPVWAFLGEVVNAMIEFKIHQYFVDPDGYWDGPSGYAGRTGGSYVYDQRDRKWRDINAAAMFGSARPLLNNVKYGSWHIPTTTDDMITSINQALDYYNGKDIEIASIAAPAIWNEGHWPPENLMLPPQGWYTQSLALINADDDSLLFPVQKTGTISRSFDDEFWFYKANDGSQDFAFFIEGLENAGNYSGWYGGSLQTFWTKNTGMIILSRHDKSGADVADKENTRVWAEIDYWATHHIWGRDEHAKAFSTAATDRISHPINYQLSASPPKISVATELGGENTKGQETGAELGGSFVSTNKFEALTNGLKVIHEITSDEADQISELWATLPVYLKNNTHQSALTDTSIDYWKDDAWQTLGVTLVTTSKLRLSRDFGSGPQSVYVVFSGTQAVKVSETIWEQSYQGSSRVRNVHIDLHGSPGTSITMPATTNLQFSLVTTE